MDVTYWGKGFGVMLFRDLNRHRNLFWCYVQSETVTDYLEGLKKLMQKGWQIVAVVCDGKSGLLNAIKNIPVQLCQYHEYKTVIRYITQQPKLPAGKSLKQIATMIFHTDKESFTGILQKWHGDWKQFLDEKTHTPERKRQWRYKHEKIRSAYKSLFKHQAFLFAWYDHPKLLIPSTNNAVEGVFSNLKNKLGVHNGLKLHRKIKLINHFLQK